MSVGFVMLVHTALDRAAQVARHWAEHGRPVVIHVDKRVSSDEFLRLKSQLSGFAHVMFAERRKCGWGSWSIVEATRTASQMMLDRFKEVDHVFLASGSCLPLRPVDELQSYLEERPSVDFIESVTTTEVDWTIGGLDDERFTLRFPFSWKTQRRLFDRYVRLQRRLKLRRKIPKPITPHLGSQWWCLSRKTLSAILNDPRRPEFDAYFRHVWIPDESYFQTLCRLHSSQIESRSLTLAKFDFQGKPHLFYDDHVSLLRRSDCFVGRKIWPKAELLYREFLVPSGGAQTNAEPNPQKIDRLFSRATERRVRGRPGLYMPGRFPRAGLENGITAGRYSVFQGLSDLFTDFQPWLERQTGHMVHGRLFAPERAEFAGGEVIFKGALTDNAAIRDFRPRDFLTNLLWSTRGQHQCFQFSPADRQEIAGVLKYDKNASITIITGAWTIPLLRSEKVFADLRRDAARLQKVEASFLDMLRSGDAKSRVRVWSLAEFIDDPMVNLQTVLDELGMGALRRLTEVPAMADLTGLEAFLQKLKNEGMNPHLVGDFAGSQVDHDSNDGPRPYLVR